MGSAILQTERVVNQDHTIHIANRALQIEKTKWRGMLAKCRMLVCEHLDGTWSVFYGPHCVGHDCASGLAQAHDLLTTEKPAPPAAFSAPSLSTREAGEDTTSKSCANTTGHLDVRTLKN
jgi:hypothetical protein